MSTNNSSGSERRRFVRYKLKATAEVMFDNQVKEQGELEDISNGGMYLNLGREVPKKYLEGSSHASIYAISSGEEVTIEAECSVVRIEPEGVALFFSSIDSANRQILRDLIGELNDLVRDSRK